MTYEIGNNVKYKCSVAIFLCLPMNYPATPPNTPDSQATISPELISASTPDISPSPIPTWNNRPWDPQTLQRTPTPWRPFSVTSGIDLRNWEEDTFMLPPAENPMPTDQPTSMQGSVLNANGQFEIREVWTLEDSTQTFKVQGTSESGSLI